VVDAMGLMPPLCSFSSTPTIITTTTTTTTLVVLLVVVVLLLLLTIMPVCGDPMLKDPRVRVRAATAPYWAALLAPLPR